METFHPWIWLLHWLQTMLGLTPIMELVYASIFKLYLKEFDWLQKRVSLKTFLWGYLFPVPFIPFTEKTFYLRWCCMLPLGFRPSSWTFFVSPTVTTKWKPIKNVTPSFTFAEPYWLQITGISQPWVRMLPVVNCNWMEVNRVIIWPTEALLLGMMCEKTTDWQLNAQWKIMRKITSAHKTALILTTN